MRKPRRGGGKTASLYPRGMPEERSVLLPAPLLFFPGASFGNMHGNPGPRLPKPIVYHPCQQPARLGKMPVLAESPMNHPA